MHINPHGRRVSVAMRETVFACLIAICGFAGSGVNAQSSEDIERQNLAVVRASFDAWRAGSGSPYDLLGPDATWTIVGRSLVSKMYPNREAFMSEVIRPFNARMQSALKPTIRQIHASENVVVVFFDAEGTSLDGQPYNNTYAWFLEMQHGRIVKAFAFFDSIAFNALWQRVTPANGKK